MKKGSACPETLSLLDWTPPRLAVGFEDQSRVRAASLSQRIARSVSETLKDDERPREDIADAMTDYLGTEVPVATLNAYASPAREDHNITLERAIALLAVTGDARLIGDLIQPAGYAVIPVRFLAAIEEAMCADVIERAEARKRAARRNWKRGKS
tara:strand:+ start:341 stop:805 length:465 start_codon:yes stop_codon:yes gene_type:complete